MKRYGTELLQPDKTIDRSQLSKLAYSSRKEFSFIASNTQKYIFLELFKDILYYCVWKGETQLFVDIPLLFETPWLSKLCGPIVLVYLSSQEEQIARLMKRDAIARDLALQKIQKQLDLGYKLQRSQILICNDGSKEALR